MDYVITKYGAVADGTTNNAGAIQEAIDACTKAGGGRVIIPAGRFLSGTLILKSNMELYLEQGAILTGSLEQSDLIDITQSVKDANADIDWTGGCFLYACHEENITISGYGTIYGQGNKVFYEDGADGGAKECPKGLRMQKRPRTMYLEDVENLTVKNITFKDAAFWTLHMAGCRRVLVDGIRIFNDLRGFNNDGIDPDSCQSVVITNCIVESGDDAIVVKNSIPMAQKYGACEDIVISNCILSSHDSAIKIGTETAYAIRHILIHDCVFRNCSRGIGIWVRDGGTIEDIQAHHITGNTLRFADRIIGSHKGGWWGKGEPIFISATHRNSKTSKKSPGIIRNLSFDHIHIVAESCIFLGGEQDSCICDVKMKDIAIVFQKQGTQDCDSFDEQPSDRGVYKHEIPAVYARWVKNVKIQGTFEGNPDVADATNIQIEYGSDVVVE